jgi:predicted PurR-regulated permease PerM
MKKINWIRVLTILLVLLAAYALLAIVADIIGHIIGPLLLLVLAALLAYVLTPVVDRLQAIMHSPRSLAILVTYLLVGALLFGLGDLLTQPLVAEVNSLVASIKNPSSVQNVQAVQKTTTVLLQRAKAYRDDIARGKLSAATKLISAQQPLKTCPPLTSDHYSLPPLFDCLNDQLVPSLTQPGAVKAGHTKGVIPKPIPATQVPPSYVKPIIIDSNRLRMAIQTAQQNLSTTPQNTSIDAEHIVRATTLLNNDAHQLYTTVKSTPVLILAIQTQLDRHRIPINVRSLLGQAITKVGSQSTTIINNVVAILTSTITVIFDLIIVLVMSFYLLADGGRFVRWIMGLVPERNREQAWFFIKSLDRVLGGYIRGQIIVAITVGILAGVGTQLLGIPYALLVGLFAFLTETIPVIGPVIASVPAGLISLFTQPAWKTAAVAGWFFLIQQLESNVIGPRVTGHLVGIHPVEAIIAIIAGFEVGGFLGAFLAIPIVGILHVVVREAYSYIVLKRPLPTAEMPGHLEMPEAEEERGSKSPPAAE